MGSLSPSSSDSHATGCLQSVIHSLTSVVLPKPAGAEISVIPAARCKLSFIRSINRRRETTLGRGGGTYSLVAKIGADIGQLYNAPAWPSHCASHRDDDISLLVSCFDISVSLGHLFKRIAPINNRFCLPCLNQLFEGD